MAHHGIGSTLRSILKITAWTVMAAVLAIAAITMCFLRLVSSETLTLITNDAANKLLDAQVTVGKVRLSSRGGMPVLNLEVDSVVVMSGPMMRLDSASRSLLPEWGDTLFTLGHFRGGINLLALLHRKIDLYDVEFDGPEINLVALNDSVTNYYIYNYSSENDSVGTLKMPAVAINRFSIKRPKPLRFHNALTGNHFSLNLSAVDIVGGDKPVYSLSMGGDVNSPMLALYNTDKLDFGIDGHMGWKPEHPTELEINNFKLHANFLNAIVSARVNFGREIVVDNYTLDIPQTKVEDLLHLIPDSLQTRFGLTPGHLTTGSDISVTVSSNGPFNLNTDSVPVADVRLSFSPGFLKYDNVYFSDVSGQIIAELRGNDLDQSVFTLDKFKIEGESIVASLDATLTDVASDPGFSGSFRGRSTLSRLPAPLVAMLDGYLTGTLSADITFNGRRSMLSNNGFHKIKIEGDVDLHDVYFLSADTANMLSLGNAALKFGDRIHNSSDTLLTASLKVDSVAFLHTQYSVKVSDLSLSTGGLKTARPSDSTTVIPFGGALDIGHLGLTVLGDSILFDVRKSSGHLTLKRFKQRPDQPLIALDLGVKNMAVGTPDTRFLLNGSQVDVSALKLKVPSAAGRRERRAAARIRRAYPHLPPDSVYARARYEATHKKKGPYPRVHPELRPDSAEIISWGTSKFLRSLLTDWRLKGSVTARRGALFTPLFPLRNRMRNFNISFNNDTLLLRDVKYKLGSSDFLLSGRVSNLARSLTSRNYTQILKLNFELRSDTVDINELADATFRGSAYASTRKTVRPKLNMYAMISEEDLDDERLERELGKMVENAPHGRAPLLVPKNIDAKIVLNAANVLYSDIRFRDVAGELMLSQGALNIRDISARSDAGAVSLSALYSSPDINNLKFGFGLDVNRFNIERFIRLVPAIDSVMPLLHDFSGIIDAEVAATCNIDPDMNIALPSLDAAVRISGDSLAFINPETYSKIGKWLGFKNRNSNIVRHLNVDLTVHDNLLQVYPFIFDLDRYRLGVEGYNDLDMNFRYHLAVLKSPLPFKFGVTVSGNPHKYKVRFGKAGLNENQVARSVGLVDTVRVNLLAQLQEVFRRGVSASRFAHLEISDRPLAADIDLDTDTLTHADSIAFVREGLIPATEINPAKVPSDTTPRAASARPSAVSKIKGVFSRKRKNQKNQE